MTLGLLAIIYLLFFLSGAAALIYQVVWVRSLTLVFGGSHLAVTAVLSIFMSGLALGAYVVGQRVDRAMRPLRLYGLLELGIAASALVSIALIKVYPAIYVPLARGHDDARLYLTFVRLAFSTVALILPTTLMGATLPVLSRLTSRQPENVRHYLSFLYGFNTLGSVLGALLAGFVFLRAFSVSTTLSIAIVANALIGAISLALQRWSDAGPYSSVAGTDRAVPGDAPPRAIRSLPALLVLVGIGASGFCALGYEVLWTRVLTIGLGASVYGFTIMLVAFLTGIALGSKAYGVAGKVFRAAQTDTARSAAWFGTGQILIGLTALLVTVYLRDVPANTVRLQSYFFGNEPGTFQSRTWANFSLAFLYMLVPAMFMGAAFPLAGQVMARERQAVGRAVGDVLASNTVGAIFGAAVSGLVMIPLFGIERSLQMLIVVNLGIGLIVLASVRGVRWLPTAAAAGTAGVLVFLALNQDALRMWDRQYFAIFRSNQPDAFRTPEMVREAVANTDVLYYAEGAESTVSVIRVKGGEQAFITNGRVEASSYLQGQQVQYALGHLPMLLTANPKRVLVVGMGSGMTAGATAVHAGVERVTLIEIERQVQGVARAFEAYNHHLLQNPKLRIVLNDGRNFLMTTDETFDVITADPIHPWFRGAGYLYAQEYFELAARHLRPGGVIAQWLPLYELTPDDLASIVRTFQQHFSHTMLWLTHYDSVLVGSNSPFAIDESELERRLGQPEVGEDLRRVRMGSAADLLGYFMMGTEGMKRFAQHGELNTDDRLYLEFSAPFSIGNASVMARNIRALAAHRESVCPYLRPDASTASGRQQERCNAQFAAGRAGDPVLARYLEGGVSDPSFAPALRRLNVEYPWYAPGNFLHSEYQAAFALEPRLLQESTFTLLNDHGAQVELRMSAVLVPVSKTRGSIMFVDNDSRTVFGQIFVDNYDKDGRGTTVADDVMRAVRSAYEAEMIAARDQRQALPPAAQALKVFRTVIGSKAQSVQSQL